MEEKKLYPLGFCSIADEYGWGTDEFLLADLGYRDSLIRDGWFAGNAVSELMDTYLDRVVGDNAYSFWGRQFPFQIKRINVKGTMPLRVHPDAETAAQRYDFLGRRKIWYILSSGPGARILAGWKHDTDAGEVYSKCLNGTVGDLLKSFEPAPGQYLHIPPGTPHAASGQVEILEISESSPLDFCMSGMGAEVHPDEFDENLSLVDALDFIDYKEFSGKPEKATGRFAAYPEFEIEMIDLRAPLKVGGEADTFVLYLCLKGAADVTIDVLGQTAVFPLKPMQPVLVPAECPDFRVLPKTDGTALLEITVPFRQEHDSYVG